MSTVPSPAEIRNSKQTIPTERLMLWAENSGFVLKRSRGGSSHINYRHSVYPDISGNFIACSNNLGSQRSFADCLAVIQNRQTEALNAFTQAAKEKINAAYTELPPYLIAEHDFENGWTVVRDRYLPQIGDTIPFSQMHLLENRIHNIIEPAVREAHKLLGRCRAEYDIDVDFDNGTLSHPIYKIPAFKMAPYEACEDPPKIFEDIGNFIHGVQKEDEDRSLRLGLVLAEDFVKVSTISHCAKRGERTNYLSVETPQGETARISFKTASSRRADGNIYSGRITEEELSRIEGAIERIAQNNRAAARLVA